MPETTAVHLTRLYPNKHALPAGRSQVQNVDPQARALCRPPGLLPEASRPVALASSGIHSAGAPGDHWNTVAGIRIALSPGYAVSLQAVLQVGDQVVDVLNANA